jgi:hypothetical protein
MKNITSGLLGLTLMIGSAGLTFAAQDKTDPKTDTTATTPKKVKKHKKAAKPAAPAAAAATTAPPAQ